MAQEVKIAGNCVHGHFSGGPRYLGGAPDGGGGDSYSTSNQCMAKKRFKASWKLNADMKKSRCRVASKGPRTLAGVQRPSAYTRKRGGLKCLHKANHSFFARGWLGRPLRRFRGRKFWSAGSTRSLQEVPKVSAPRTPERCGSGLLRVGGGGVETRPWTQSLGGRSTKIANSISL